MKDDLAFKETEMHKSEHTASGLAGGEAVHYLKSYDHISDTSYFLQKIMYPLSTVLIQDSLPCQQ